METTRHRSAARVMLATLYTIAAVFGLGAGFHFGLQAGGGYVLACIAGVCFAVFCTLMLDAFVDRAHARRGR